MRRVLALLSLVAVGLVVAPGAAPAARPPSGPVNLTGTLGGAPFEIRVPADWNGTLVLYAHGYRDLADHPGEIDDRSVSAFVNNAYEEAMLAAGYAIAGSAYSTNGWAVREGISDTKALARYFGSRVAQPQRTLLVGFSMGSVIAFESAEHFGGIYDGVIPSCAVGAGAPRAFDGTAAVGSAYDAVFGFPPAWGTPGDVRDDLDFETEVLPVIVAQLTAPGGFGKFELIRSIVGGPQGPEWPFSIFFFTTEGRAELERRAGGPVVQNADHTYTLSADQRAYLAGLGVSEAQMNDALAHMDANRIEAGPARHFLERYAEYSGNVKGPVLTLHTQIDALVPPAHISAYNETTAHRADLVANAWTSGVGHCNFTPQQLVTSVRALDNWVRTGVKPAAFPASEGFISFTPPPWPQP